MKKTEFVKSIAETLMEWYPTGGYRVTMDDIKKNVAPKPMKEYDDNPQGSPENQENPEYYDQQFDKPVPAQKGISNFEKVDWQDVYDTLLHNQGVIDKKIDNIALNRGDFIDEHILSYEDLEALAASGLTDLGEGSYPVLSEPMDFETFKTAAKHAFDEAMKPQTTVSTPPESAYLRGNEPMSEDKLHQIYEQFKHIIKEEINEIDFSKKLRGVVYEYAQEAPGVTPTTQDPVRDPEKNPDKVISKGQNMEDIGKAVKDMGEKVKVINSKTPPATTTPASTGIVSLKEYVRTSILPAVVEIINKSQNPRATKRELMEMFKLTKK